MKKGKRVRERREENNLTKGKIGIYKEVRGERDTEKRKREREREENKIEREERERLEKRWKRKKI